MTFFHSINSNISEFDLCYSNILAEYSSICLFLSLMIYTQSNPEILKLNIKSCCGSQHACWVFAYFPRDRVWATAEVDCRSLPYLPICRRPDVFLQIYVNLKFHCHILLFMYIVLRPYLWCWYMRVSLLNLIFILMLGVRNGYFSG